MTTKITSSKNLSSYSVYKHLTDDILGVTKNKTASGSKMHEVLTNNAENNFSLHVQKIVEFIAKKTGKKAKDCTFEDIKNCNRKEIEHAFEPVNFATKSGTPPIYSLDPSILTSISYTDPKTKKQHTINGYPRIDDNGEDESNDGPLSQRLSLYDENNQFISSVPLELTLIKGEQTYVLDDREYTVKKQKNAQSPENLTIQAAVLKQIKDHITRIDSGIIKPADIDHQHNILGAERPFLRHKTFDEEKKIQDYIPLSTHEQKEKAFFSGYSFVDEKNIPQEVANTMEQRGIFSSPKGWIHQGVISFNKTYFCRKYKLKDITRERTMAGTTLHFIDYQGNKKTVREMYKNPLYKECIKEIIATRIHEITHRVLHFNGIKELKTRTTNSDPVTVDQEFLCEVADRMSRPRTKGGKHKKDDIVTLDDGTEIFCQQLEEDIAKIIPGFTRDNIKKLDIRALQDYENEYEKFNDLAATLTEPQLNRKVDSQIKKIKKFIDDFSGDPSDPVQEQILNDALEHETKLNDLKTQLNAAASSGTQLTPDELDSANTNYKNANDFLTTHTRRPNPNPNPNNPNNPNPNNPDPNNPDPNNPNNPDPNPNNSLNRENFQKLFIAKLAGKGSDSKAKCDAGTILLIKDTRSTLPGNGHNWIKYEIINVGEEKIRLRMEDATDNLVSGSKAFELPMNENTIDRILQKGGMETMLLQKKNKRDALKSMKKGFLGGWESLDDDYNTTFTHQGKETKGPITHVGTIQGGNTANDVTYKVEFNSHKVKVTGQVFRSDATKDDKQVTETGNTTTTIDNRKALRQKNMDYETFMVFCKTKNLKPLNEQELKNAQINPDPSKIPESDISRKDKFISIGAVRNFLKAIPESIKKKRDEELEFQSALAKTQFANWIPNTTFLNLDEIKNEIGGMDGVVWQKIQKYKGERAGEKPDSHDREIFNGIEGAIFQNPTNRRNFKYKAASALLYALEKGALYPRALAKYENMDGGGYWIKILLGEEMQKAFQTKRNALIDQLKSAKLEDKEKINDQLSKLELKFIQDATNEKPFWGSKFSSEVEGHKDKLYGGANSIDPSGVLSKGNFNEMFDAFKGGGLSGNSPKTLFSALEAMEKSIETESDLKTFMSAILLLFITGTVYKLPGDYRNKLAGMGRSKGFPITLFVNNAHSSGDIVRLLDHISKNAGINSFTHYSGFSEQFFDEKNIGNYKTNQKEVTETFLDRRGTSSTFILNGFAPGEDLLKVGKYPDGSTTDYKTKRTIKSYLGKGGIFNSYVGTQGRDYIDNVDPQSPIFQKNLMNLSQDPLRQVLGLSGGAQKLQQTGASDKTILMRNNLNDILGQYEQTITSMNDANTLEPMMTYLYAKYLQMFGNKLEGSDNPFGVGPQKSYQKELEESLLINGANTGEIIARKAIIKETPKKKNNQQGRPNNNFYDDEDDTTEWNRPDIGLENAKNGVKKFTSLLYQGIAKLNKEQKINVLKLGKEYSSSSE